MEEFKGYKRGRGLEEEIWADIIFQLETSTLSVVRGALITSNAEMLFREDMPVSIVSRLLDVLVVDKNARLTLFFLIYEDLNVSLKI
jgi:hypothetical protein